MTLTPHDRPLALTGRTLTLPDVGWFVENASAQVECVPAVEQAVRRSKAFLDERLQADLVYGVNTGFGPMSSHVIGPDQMKALQRNLVLSHAVGMGEPLPDRHVLAMTLVRLNTLATGCSGVSYELIAALQDLLNHRIVAIVPNHGGVGASGDLVQLAHVALALLGEGEVRYRGVRRPAAEVLRELKLQAYALQPKEGLSLINGTSAMAAIAAVLCLDAQRALSIGVRTGALGLELVSAFDDSISERLHYWRPHHGQVTIAATLRELLSTSKLLRGRQELIEPLPRDRRPPILDDPVQEVYSLRCVPQILGPIADTLRKSWGEVETEINAVTDNPIVDTEAGAILHGGNFHGEYVAVSVDQLKAGLTKLAMLSERRINFFLNRNVNKRLPPFLNLDTPGLTLGLQGLQFVATSTAARCQTLAMPQAVHSISTNGDNQDVVSMGTDAALLATTVAEHAYVVLAIEAITLCQAVDCLKVLPRLSEPSTRFYDLIRGVFPAVQRDRLLTAELPAVVQVLKQAPDLVFPWLGSTSPGIAA